MKLEKGLVTLFAAAALFTGCRFTSAENETPSETMSANVWIGDKSEALSKEITEDTTQLRTMGFETVGIITAKKDSNSVIDYMLLKVNDQDTVAYEGIVTRIQNNGKTERNFEIIQKSGLPKDSLSPGPHT